MRNSKTIRVLIVEDHPVVRFGLVSLIDAQPDMEIVSECGSGDEALLAYNRTIPDIAIVDLRLPGMGGVELIRAICQSHSEARIVVLTTYEGDEDIHRAISAGARGYLIKAMSYEVLLAGIRRVHAGGRCIPEPIAKTLAKRTPMNDLTPREVEILQLMAQGLSNKEIAAHTSITEGTVKCHVNVILDKLGASHRTQAAVMAIQRGMVHL